jgi:choline monooxygenase
MKGSLDAELAKFDPAVPIEGAHTPPASWYVSKQFWELDRQAVFARSWQPVARRQQLEAVGSYVAGSFAGEPYVVVRSSDGLHALSNVCRHKAMQVASGAGQCEHLVCPYHGWSYHLDGRLKSAPQVAGIKSFDREALSLPRLGLCEWGPWVFINLDADAEPLADELETLDGALERSGWQELSYVATQSWTIECNWKVYVDNYLDGGYHIPHMHPSLDAQLDMSSYRTELFHRYSIQSSGAGAPGDPRTDVDSDQRIGSGAIYAWLFPNFMINRYGPCMDSNWVLPLGPDRCQVIYEFYFRDTESDEAQAFIAQSREQADITQREDIAISESVQSGLKSSHYDQGRYAPQVETGEHHFHQLLHHAYREHLGR